MNIISIIKRSVRISGIAACAVMALLSINPALAQQSNDVPAAHFVVKNLRNVGPNSVRFAAIQGTKYSPTVVLLGGNRDIWPKIRDGVRDAEAQGFPVRAILIGPADAPPALEIYANGHHVTKPIDPYRITQAELTTLLRDVSREYYPK